MTQDKTESRVTRVKSVTGDSTVELRPNMWKVNNSPASQEGKLGRGTREDTQTECIHPGGGTQLDLVAQVTYSMHSGDCAKLRGMVRRIMSMSENQR